MDFQSVGLAKSVFPPTPLASCLLVPELAGKCHAFSGCSPRLRGIQAYGCIQSPPAPAQPPTPFWQTKAHSCHSLTVGRVVCPSICPLVHTFAFVKERPSLMGREQGHSGTASPHLGIGAGRAASGGVPSGGRVGLHPHAVLSVTPGGGGKWWASLTTI